ncbi:MAG TPA: flagellar hook capping FlgD N-terminal domain-containing protein [Caulobacteraceae bacterium]|jgi:flagellar basal-body rod modification protein FlgD
MALAPVSATAPAAASNGLGLSFQSLLQIILTQLTAQNPLQPLDNFQFVSQLAEFSQLQLSQTLNDNVTSLLASQSATQAVGLLGRTVDVTTSTSSSATVSGTVKAVTFSNGTPEITVQTTAGATIANVAISSITQVM